MIIEDENGREWTTDELRDQDREPTEPDPEPPLDLDEIEAMRQVYLSGDAETSMGAAIQLARFTGDLLDELREFRAEEERREKLHVRGEWALTASGGERPDHTTRWYHSPENAETSYGRPGQLWSRTLTIGEAGPISDEAPS